MARESEGPWTGAGPGGRREERTRNHLSQERPERQSPNRPPSLESSPPTSFAAARLLPAPPSAAVGPIAPPAAHDPPPAPARAGAEVREPPAGRLHSRALTGARCPRNGTMTAEETKAAESGAQSAPLPLEGVDISPKQDEGVLKVRGGGGGGCREPVAAALQ